MQQVFIAIAIIASTTTMAQNHITELRANGPGNTYKLINSEFCPNKGNAVEAPGIKTGSCDNHSTYKNSMGNSKHITEINDPVMGPVFEFVLHKDEDKDRHKCGNTDRQRNEIKTYKSSPDEVLATKGETVVYQWSMKLPKDFQVSKSFTHLHQIKSVGGIDAEEKIPSFTLTAYRKDKGDQLHLRYSETTTQESIAKLPLDLLRGNWISFTESIEFKDNKRGKYHLLIKDMNTGKVLLNFTEKLKTYKTKADFMRPKWGIYRSLKYPDQIKDEKVLFGYFKITEVD